MLETSGSGEPWPIVIITTRFMEGDGAKACEIETRNPVYLQMGTETRAGDEFGADPKRGSRAGGRPVYESCARRWPFVCASIDSDFADRKCLMA